MASGLQQDLREALRLRLEPQVQDANLLNCRAAFKGGSAVYSVAQLYSFFNLSGVDASKGENVKDIFDRDFVEAIRLLESTEPGEVRLCELYPLMRRIMILMEGYLHFVSKSPRLEGTVASNHSLPSILIYDVLDSLYDDVCGGSLGKETLLSDLEIMLGQVNNGLDSVLLSLSGFINLLVPIIANSFEKESGNPLESLIAIFTFGALQRIAAHLLMLAVVDQSVSAVPQKQPKEEKLLILSGEEALSENMYRLDFLCKETLCKSLYTRITDHCLATTWQDEIVEPSLVMLQLSFLTIGKIIPRKEVLADVVVATTVGFLSKAPGDCAISKRSFDIMGNFGSKLLRVFYQALEEVNVSLWSHFEMQLQHVLKIQNSRNSQAPESPKHINGAEARLNGNKVTTPKNCPLTRSLSTMLSASEVQTRFNELLAIMEYHAKRQEELLDILFDNSPRDDLEIVDHLSRFFVHFSNLVQLGDALLYITLRSPNAEISELLKQTTGSTYTVLCAICDKLPFRILKACFYNLGSEFHSRNLAAQICCFNIATRDIATLQEAYEANNEVYCTYVDMLRPLLRASSSACCTCVSYRQNKAKRLSMCYLTVSSSFIGRWFIMESLIGPGSENRGLLDAFVAWCHSDSIEEYMLARFLCRLLARLAKEDKAFTQAAAYVLDILLGICLHFDREDQGLKSVLHPLDLGRLNTFKCLAVFLENGIFKEWIMEHVVLPYTCAFTREVTQYTEHFTGDRGQQQQKSSECYFSSSAEECKCMEAPFVNGLPSPRHYLELLSALSWGCYVVTNEDRCSLMLRHVLVMLSGMLGKLVQFLHANKERGDLESRFAMFVLCAKVTSVLVGSGNFGRKNNQVVLILKLYSLLGNQKVCMPEAAELYLSLILQALRVFHAIFDHVPVKDQLLKLHNGFLALLFSKINNYPGFLLRHELYKDVPAKLVEQMSGYFANMLQQSKLIGHYLGSMYNFKVWTVCRDYKVERDDVKQEHIEGGLRDQDESPELRIMVNISFLVFCRIEALFNSSDTRSLMESGSSVGIYTKGPGDVV